ncbi:MAG: DUF1957 domain-containing protein, partial [Candidatus Geothermincolia bacterium]
SAHERLAGLLSSATGADPGRLGHRFLAQAARETLLLESSDWPYMVAKDRAGDYAIERFRCHLERFEFLAEALESSEMESAETGLSEIEEADNIFAGLDLRVVSGQGWPDGSEGR